MLVSFVLIAQTAATYAQKPAVKYIAVKAAEAQKTLKKRNIVILDVRTPEENAIAKIPGSVNHDFRSADFAQQLSALPKNKPYFVYCRSGSRSEKAVAMMRAMGFRKIYELEGGFLAYEKLQKN